MKCDFSGYATRNDLKCSDGRTIRSGAFKHQDGETLPLVWQHGHSSIENVLGHAILENRQDGVYAYCFLNDTPQANTARELLKHGDIKQMSIHAVKLQQNGMDVLHGVLTEVSLVIKGANPGAFIENVYLTHDDYGLNDEAIISTGDPIELQHSDSQDSGDEVKIKSEDQDTKEETVEEVYNSLTEKQKALVAYLVQESQPESEEGEESDESAEHSFEDTTDPNSDQEGETLMHVNVFEQASAAPTAPQLPTLTHDQISTIITDGQRLGSFKESLLAHAGEYGITNIDMLFPDFKAIDTHPEWITRKMEWVEGVLNGARKLPFSRIKSMSADLTHEEARAKGYIKSTMKKEQFFAVAKRETGPKTIYKKQKLDRDDIIDITDFDVVAWLWVEMNFMLREELARAILIGDGRAIEDPDKIDESKIRPIALDDEFYTDVLILPDDLSKVGAKVEAVLKGRNAYKGTAPTAYMTFQTMADMLLERDSTGRRLYRTRSELAAELEVSKIETVDILEGAVRDGRYIEMIIVNMSDYGIGSTKGGEITRFNQFDIDFNQEKYLIETRVSGALLKHKRAQVVLGALVTPPAP